MLSNPAPSKYQNTHRYFHLSDRNHNCHPPKPQLNSDHHFYLATEGRRKQKQIYLIIQSVVFACRCALTNAWWSHAHAISNSVNWLARDRHGNHVVHVIFQHFLEFFHPGNQFWTPNNFFIICVFKFHACWFFFLLLWKSIFFIVGNDILIKNE